MLLLEQKPELYLRSPSLEADTPGVVLRVRCSDGVAEAMLSFRIDESGELVGPPNGVRTPIPEPSVDEDRVHSNGVWSVWVTRQGYLNTLWCRSESGLETKVWEGHGTVAAPYVLEVPGGAWVAFHHNLREDNHEPDIAKWIALRFVDGKGEVWEVDTPMVGRDRDMQGEEQSFEFASLVAADEGAVAIVGRGAHQYWRQDVNDKGFALRQPVGEGGWGCRGRRAAAVVSGSRMLVAWRERKGIRVQAQAPPSGARPPLKRARVAQPSRAPVVQERPPDDFAQAHGLRTLFGDIHQHSAHSDGIGSADEPYLRARYRYGDDFCALTDHESFLGKRIESVEWGYLQRVAESHHEPGTFVTLLAYEWTAKMHPGPGHKVCYFPEFSRKVYSRDVLTEGDEIVEAVKAAGGFAVPHHVGWTGANESAHDEVGQPVWEICSCHGCYEHWAHELGQRGELRDQMVDAVLQRGHRFGFIASSDGHGLLWHHGVARKRDPFRTGLTAVQASACTRQAILDAIRARRCYATSGAKINLNFEVNGSPMGAVADLRGAQVLVQVHGTAPLRSVELVDAQGVRKRWDLTAPRFEERAELDAQKYLYVRVRQQDGEMAWSSPVFAEEA